MDNYANRDSYTITVYFNIKLESIKVRNYLCVWLGLIVPIASQPPAPGQDDNEQAGKVPYSNDSLKNFD